MDIAREFFEMPDEDKALYYSEDPGKPGRLYTSIDYGREKVHFWRDTLRHPAHPCISTFRLGLRGLPSIGTASTRSLLP